MVDDNDDFREMCAEYLTIAGYEVLQAENGVAAIETAVRKKPDLVVMDLQMPIMGGLEAIQRLRFDARTRGIPVIVVSADDVGDHARAKRVGCNTCLGKPCSPDELEGIIRTLVDTTRSDSASRA